MNTFVQVRTKPSQFRSQKSVVRNLTCTLQCGSDGIIFTLLVSVFLCFSSTIFVSSFLLFISQLFLSISLCYTPVAE
jgi:hypothetical protein